MTGGVSTYAPPAGLGRPGHEAPADLGREDEGVAGPAPERRADAALAQPVPVERRRIEVADAGGPGRPHRVDGHGLGDRAEEVAEGRPAEPEPGHPHRRAPERARLDGIDRGRAHGSGVRRGGQRGAAIAMRAHGPAYSAPRRAGLTAVHVSRVAQRLSTRPGRPPVCRPSAITGAPLTRTQGRPRGYRWGSAKVARSATAAGSKHHHVGGGAGREAPAVPETELLCRQTGHLADRLRERHHAALADVVAEEPRARAVVPGMGLARAVRPLHRPALAVRADHDPRAPEAEGDVVLAHHEEDDVGVGLATGGGSRSPPRRA